MKESAATTAGRDRPRARMLAELARDAWVEELAARPELPD